MKSFSEHLVVDMFDPQGITPVFDANHRVHIFGSADEVLLAGFHEDSFVYKAARAQFSQSPHIGKIFVGLKTAEDASWTAALTAIKNQNNDWYALSVSARTMVEQQMCATWAQAAEKLLILASGDTAIVDAESGDIADWAKVQNLDRVAVFYHPEAGTPTDPIPEAAYFGKLLTKQPGSATWADKQLEAVATYQLTDAQVTKAYAKNATIYTSIADVPITEDGRVANGEYIDIIHGLDWLKARIQNKIFTPISQMDKVPFTEVGITIISDALRAALDEGVKVGLLREYTITTPTLDEVPADKKAGRTLPDVKFTAPLSGAIQHVIVEGVVTL
jgi:hypothetical protein